MGLDAAVYADDDCETKIAGARIGNLDYVVRLRALIEDKCPQAIILLTKVLHTAFHSGNSLLRDDVQSVKTELADLATHCADDELVQQFVREFGGVVDVALQHNRPLTFS
jgi:hypothetical protein